VIYFRNVISAFNILGTLHYIHTFKTKTTYAIDIENETIELTFKSKYTVQNFASRVLQFNDIAIINSDTGRFTSHASIEGFQHKLPSLGLIWTKKFNMHPIHVIMSGPTNIRFYHAQ